MAKKPKASPPWFQPQWEKDFGEPVVVLDPHAMARGPWLGRWVVLGYTFEGFRAVGRIAHMDGVNVGVVDRVIHARHYGNYKVPSENTALQSIIQGIKSEMLTHGATPLAVQWVGEVEPFTEQELNIMAEKLTKGGAAAKKSADKKAPVAKKGNPEALAKAREARAAASAGPDTRKITVLKKPHGAREGTTRATLLDTIYKSKTVQDAVDAGVKKSDVAWAARAEYISLK